MAIKTVPLAEAKWRKASVRTAVALGPKWVVLVVAMISK